MKNLVILTAEKMQTAVNECARILTEEPNTWTHPNQVSRSFGPLGVLSPISRTAFVAMFGEEQTDNVESKARALLDEQKARINAYHFADYARQADRCQGVPTEGAFVWATSSNLKGCGLGVVDEIRNQIWCSTETDNQESDHKRLCKVTRVFVVTPDELTREHLADELVEEHHLEGGNASDDLPDDVDIYRFTDEQINTFYTVGAIVTDGTRWFLIDSEGYDYARYLYLPMTWATMYAKEAEQIRKANQEAKEEEERKAAEAKAARLADYQARAAKWYPFMTDIRPLEAAEEAAHDDGRLCWRKGTKEREILKAAERKVTNTRRANISAMVRAAFPGLKFSVTTNHGWGANFTLTWTDGPTEQEMTEATDLDLFASRWDTFDGMTDSAGIEHAEFIDFALYTMGKHAHGDVELDRDESDDARDIIRTAVREALDDNTQEINDEDILTDEQIGRIVRYMETNDPQITYGHLHTGAYIRMIDVIYRIWKVTGFYASTSDGTTQEQPKETTTEQVPASSGTPKNYYKEYCVGSAKYVVNFHDGVKTHPDGSAFYDIRIFKKEREMNQFINQLFEQGYRDRNFVA